MTVSSALRPMLNVLMNVCRVGMPRDQESLLTADSRPAFTKCLQPEKHYSQPPYWTSWKLSTAHTYLRATPAKWIMQWTNAPATWHRWIYSTLTSARQAGIRFTHHWRMKGWVGFGGSQWDDQILRICILLNKEGIWPVKKQNIWTVQLVYVITGVCFWCTEVYIKNWAE